MPHTNAAGAESSGRLGNLLPYLEINNENGPVFPTTPSRFTGYMQVGPYKKLAIHFDSGNQFSFRLQWSNRPDDTSTNPPASFFTPGIVVLPGEPVIHFYPIQAKYVNFVVTGIIGDPPSGVFSVIPFGIVL